MFQSKAPSQIPSEPETSALETLSRTLQTLEDRLARRQRPAPAARDEAPRPAAAPAPASWASAPAPAPADEPRPAARKAVLTDAVSQIVMRRQMLDRAPPAALPPAPLVPAPLPRASVPSAAPALRPMAASAERLEARRETRLKSLAEDLETLKAEGSGFSLMSEVAGELQRLREELREEKTGRVDPRFEEMRAAFDDLRHRIEARESTHLIGPELTRIADALAQLTEEGADRSTLNTLRAELEEMRGLFGEMARDTTVKAVGQRWDAFETRYSADAEREIEVKRDLKDELERLRVSLRSLASEDHIKAVEKRWDDFETHYRETPPAPSERTISKLLQTELEALRGQLDALSEKAPLEAVEKRWDALEEKLDSRDVEQSIQRLGERMGDIEARLAQLPDSLVISALEERVRTLAQGVETLAMQGPEAEQFVMIEDRLDEISRAILATSLQQPAIDMAPIERIEARIATLAGRIDKVAAEGEAEALAERIADLSARVEAIAEDGAHEAMAERMAALAERFETAFAELETPRVDTSEIEARLAALTARLETAPSPQTDPGLVRSLEAQIARLAQRLDQPVRSIAPEPDPEFERRLAAIEERLDDQRDALISAAREIADDTARRMQSAGDQRQSEHVAQLSESLRALEGLSRQNDERAGQVFESLHGTLMKIVDRLEQIEHEVAGGAGAPIPAAAPRVSEAVEPAGPGRGLKGAVTRRAVRGASADAQAPAFLTAAGAERGPQADAREAMAAPALDTADMLDRREVNRPLEPGSGAPDIGALLERLQLQRGKGAGHREPVGDAELVAAARRASKAAAAAIAEEAAERPVRAAGAAGGGRMASFIQKRRKPILLAVLAVIAALAVLPLKQAILPSAGEAEREASAQAAAPVAAAPAAPVAAARPSAAPAKPGTPPAARAPVPSGAAPLMTNASMPQAASLPQTTGSTRTAAAASPAPLADRVTPPTESVPRRNGLSMEAAAVLSRAEAKLPAAASADIPAAPAGIGSPALVSAAGGGDAKALFEIGLRLMEGRSGEPKPADAVVWFAQAAKRGFAPAQYSLGTLFEKGNGVARDTGAARDWYVLGAEQGNVRAMHNLAVLYATGIEGVSDPDRAVEWFEKAAGYGMRDSQYNLGILYARGSGTEQDLVSSYKWFAIVAKTGDKDAEAKKDEIAKSLSPEQLKTAQDIVIAWAPKTRPEAANTVELPPQWTEKSDTTASVDMKRAIRNIQAILGKLGYDAGTPDGVIGDKTKLAITAFQRQAGLKATGSVDEPLIRALLERKDG